MRTALTKELEDWEDFQKVKNSERRWVQSICEKEILKGEALDYRLTVEELTKMVCKALEQYPDEEFYMTDAEIEHVCLSFLEDDVIKDRMARVD